jgi:hypothetical protein
MVATTTDKTSGVEIEMDKDKCIATVDECLALVREHRLVAMEKRMRVLEGLLTTLRNGLSAANTTYIEVPSTGSVVKPEVQ